MHISRLLCLHHTVSEVIVPVGSSSARVVHGYAMRRIAAACNQQPVAESRAMSRTHGRSRSRKRHTALASGAHPAAGTELPTMPTATATHVNASEVASICNNSCSYSSDSSGSSQSSNSSNSSIDTVCLPATMSMSTPLCDCATTTMPEAGSTTSQLA